MSLSAADHPCRISLLELTTPIASASESFSTSSSLFAVEQNKDGIWIPTSERANQRSSEEEMKSIKTYARYLKESGNDTALLLSDYDGLSIPSFDGVIFDSEGRAAFNLQLKTLKFSSIKSMVKQAIEKIERTSRDISFWDNYPSPSKSFFWARVIKHVFGISPYEKPRPSQIVIEIRDDPSHDQLMRLAKSLQENLDRSTSAIDSIVFLTEFGVIHIKRSQVHSPFASDFEEEWEFKEAG